MSSVPIETVLASIDQAVQPSEEFSTALLASLLDELDLEMETAPEVVSTPEPRATWRSRPLPTGWPRALVAGGVALILAITLVVVDILPGRRSASAVVGEARSRFARLPSFEATVVRRLPGVSIAEERGLEQAPAMLVTRRVSYLDDEHWRMDVTSNNYDDLSGDLGKVDHEPSAGSFTVTDGEYLARYLVRENLFEVGPLEDEGLGDIRFDATASMDPALHTLGDPDTGEFEEKCDVLADVEHAGRTAHRVHCVDLQLVGTNTDIWFDAATGLVLRLEAHARSGTKLPPGEGEGVFHDVTALTTGVDPAPATFQVEPPDGARVTWLGASATPERFRAEVDPGVSALIEQRGTGGPIVAAGDWVWATGLEGGDDPQFTGAVSVLARIDPATNEIVERIPLEYFRPVPDNYSRRYSGPLVSPVDLEVVGDELWVAESHNGSEIRKGSNYHYRYWISRFDLATGDRIATTRYDGNASGISVGETGAWLSSSATRSKRFGAADLDFGSIVRVDPETGEIEEAVDPFGKQWSGAFTAAFGSVWASWMIWDDVGSPDDFGRNILVRADERTGRLTTIDLPTDHSGQGRQSLVAARGSLWMTIEVGERASLLKIDPDTNRIVDRSEIGKVPGDLAFAEGYLWYVDTAQNRLKQLDPRRGEIVREVRVPDQPTSLTVGFGAVWVNTLQDGIVARVDIFR